MGNKKYNLSKKLGIFQIFLNKKNFKFWHFFKIVMEAFNLIFKFYNLKP